MKTKRMLFDLEKVKQGAKVVTRNGCPARIVDYNVKDKDYPILGLVYTEGREDPFKFTIDGKFYLSQEDTFDLFIEEEVKERCMTYYEVAMWLTEKPHRQYKVDRCSWIYTHLSYFEKEGNETADNFLIRENGGEWHRPMITE